jgi:hypothetical protein
MWLTVISDSIVAIVMLVSAAIIYPSYKKTQDRLIGYFCIFFAGFGVMHIFITLGAVFSGSNSVLAGTLFLVAHYVEFLTLAIFLILPIRIVLPRFEKMIFYALIVFALVASVVISMNPPLPSATPQGLTNWNIPLGSLKAVVSFTGVTVVLAVILFIVSAVKAPETIFKIRFILFIVGILIFLIAGPSHNFAKTTAQYLLADALTPVGGLIMLLGVLLPRMYKKTDSAQNNTRI